MEKPHTLLWIRIFSLNANSIIIFNDDSKARLNKNIAVKKENTIVK